MLEIQQFHVVIVGLHQDARLGNLESSDAGLLLPSLTF
jgi:hypothetical protein